MNESTLLTWKQYEETLHIKKWIVTLCAILLCLINQIKGSAYGALHPVVVNFTGFAIAGIILTAYHLKDFHHPLHYAWLGFFFVPFLLSAHTLTQSGNHYEIGYQITFYLNIWIYGHAIIATLLHYIRAKKIPGIRWIFLALWVYMMLGMITSRYDGSWPSWFFVVFGVFYFTEYTEDEKNCLVDGLLNGILISFALIQGFACCYRLFDSLRYDGLFTNCNINALFYVITQAAALGKYYRLQADNRHWSFKLSFYLFNALLIGFCYTTGGRTALAVMLVNSALSILLIFFVDHGWKMAKFLLRASLLPVVTILLFPVVFYSVRFVPVHFASPLMLGANDTPIKIKIEDFSPDHKQLVNYERFWEQSILRIENINYKELKNLLEDLRERLPSLLPTLTVYAAQPSDAPKKEITYGSGESSEDAYLQTYADANDFNIRIDMYRYYFHRLNREGHTRDEVYFWVAKNYLVPHCHDLYIQMLFNFGWIPGLLFIALAFLTVLFYTIGSLFSRTERRHFFPFLLFLTGFLGFGLFELDWEVGQMSLTLFFVSLYFLMEKVRKEKTEKTAASKLPLSKIFRPLLRRNV